jgi:hypothetical protein
LASIEERLQALEDEREIRFTLDQYCFAKDHGPDTGPLLDSFTETGTFEYYPVGRWAEPINARFEGRDELERWDGAQVATRATPGRLNKHFIASPRIDVTGDRAVADTYFLRLEETPQGPLIASMGRYRDILVRCDDGRWRIQERRVEREATVPSGPDRAPETSDR